MILDIKPLGQRDTRWASQRLGTVNSTTIGSDGCVITCHAMSMTARGKEFTPSTIDNFLTENKLYYEGNKWIPVNSTKVWDQYKFIKIVYCETTPAPINEIIQSIDKGQTPTLWLINGGIRHNVLAVGYDGNHIIVNDPWMGDQVYISHRWGNDSQVILEVDFYEGPPIASTTPTPPIDDCLLKLKEKTELETFLRGEIQKKDDLIKSQNTQCALDIQTINKQKESIALQLYECQKQSDIYKAEYDKANAPTGYKSQIIELERQKKVWNDKEQEYISKAKDLKEKYDTMKKPFKDILASILDKLNQCIKT